MTDIGESIGIDAAAPTKEDCWYCTEEKKGDQKTKIADDLDSSGDGEHDLHNDSSELGKAIGDRPAYTVTLDGNPVSVTMAAHHIIPGNASLKNATKLLKFMQEGDTVDEDVGYNVNCEQNGIWLPATPGGGWATIGASTEEAKNEYAREAMSKSKTQFHNAHPNYSDVVKKSLVTIADKLVKKTSGKCPICNKDMKNSKRPPFGLVGRLHSVSDRYRKYLKDPAREWKLSANIATSQRSALRLAIKKG